MRVPDTNSPSTVPARHNLRDVTVSVPLRCLVAITGVSGSGKSTLVNDILYSALARELNGTCGPGRHRRISGFDKVDKVVHVDQGAIGRTPRSNPATYTGVFDAIRRLFAETTEAKIRGYQPGRFSFNVKGGRCEACSGDGTIKIEMNALPDVYVPCEVCHGARYNRETLEVHFKGKTIAEGPRYADRGGRTSRPPCPSSPGTCGHAERCRAGLCAARPAGADLSGGEEHSEVKLASELQKRSTGRTVYVLDEPTTGLHFEDVRKLLGVLGKLVEQGNTVIVIERNLDVIKDRRLGHRPRTRGVVRVAAWSSPKGRRRTWRPSRRAIRGGSCAGCSAIASGRRTRGRKRAQALA